MADSEQIDILLTAAFGLEAIVRREVEALGYQATVIQPGRLLVQAELETVAQLNLWVRTAERVLIRVGDFDATDFGLLFDGTHALPWERWIPADGEFPVRGRSHKSQLSSVPACQRMVKKAIVEKLRSAHGVQTLEETGPKVTVEVALLDDRATLTIDTSGDGLHKRGYRPASGLAPLRETLCASLVQLSFWKPDRPLVDPFCGTGTIAIEAAMIGRNMAPGLNRSFASEKWPAFDADVWKRAREQARDLIKPNLPLRIRAMDVHPSAVGMARVNAEYANVADDIHFHQKPFDELTSRKEYGCVISNPPYGIRMTSGKVDEDIEQLYRSIPIVLRHLPTWSHYIFTAFPDLERVFGRRADRRRKLYNGRIECCYYQFHGPRPPRNHFGSADKPTENPNATSEAEPEAKDLSPHVAEKPTAAIMPTVPSEPAIRSESSVTSEPAVENKPTDTSDSTATHEPETKDEPKTETEAPSTEQPKPAEPAKPAFGGLLPEAERQATEFANRLRKRARHLRKWPGRGITCFRLYERDIPEIPLVVDRYESSLHIAEFERPHERTPAQHEDWLELMCRTAAETLEIDRKNVFLKHRDRQRGTNQYTRVADSERCITVQESGLRFEVNLSDYIDTGLFLDHRNTRQMVREMASDMRMLNLFAYTGSFSVYAAAGGASETTTVDLSRTYLDWAKRNLQLNDLDQPQHQQVQSDSLTFLRSLPSDMQYDLIVVDPPTFSNSKRTDEDWDVQRDQRPLFELLRRRLAEGGTLFFSTNFRRFKLETDLWDGFNIHEISRRTVPDDFRNKRIHRCWKIEHPSAGDSQP